MGETYIHPVNGKEISMYSCMECGEHVEYQFGVCGSCVARLGEAQAQEQVQDAKAEYEREQWYARRRGMLR